MDGENNGKPYEQMDDLGGFPPIFGGPPIYKAANVLSFALLQKTVFDYFLVLFTQVTMCMSFRSWSLPSLKLEFSGWKRETETDGTC